MQMDWHEIRMAKVFVPEDEEDRIFFRMFCFKNTREFGTIQVDFATLTPDENKHLLDRWEVVMPEFEFLTDYGMRRCAFISRKEN